MTKHQKAKQRQKRRRESLAKNSHRLHKGTVDPKWLVRGNISNYNMSDTISNGGS